MGKCVVVLVDVQPDDPIEAVQHAAFYLRRNSEKMRAYVYHEEYEMPDQDLRVAYVDLDNPTNNERYDNI